VREAIQALDAARMSEQVKATNDLKEWIVQQWPEEPETRELAAQLKAA